MCQVLDIHRGDRMKTLVSMDTKPFNGPKIYELKNGVPCPDFRNADQTSTLIRTQKGKTMLIQHDVMTPRPTRWWARTGMPGNIRWNYTAFAKMRGLRPAMMPWALKRYNPEMNSESSRSPARILL